MNNFTVTCQMVLFPDKDADREFHIKDDLLFDCIGMGSSQTVTGFNNSKELGYALLTYFASRALNFRRIPFCEDRIYSQYRASHDQKTERILCKLDETSITAICNELLALYKHTQSHLTNKSIKYVNIRRELKIIDNCNRGFEQPPGYVETIIQLKRSAELLDIPEVQIEMDTLNSFGDQGAYCSDIALELSIPIENILYCSRLIASRTNKQYPVESGEWVVINKSPTGIVSLPTSAIRVRKGCGTEERKFTIKDAERFMKDYNPIYLRPLYHSNQVYGTHGFRLTLKRKIIQKILNLLCKED